MPNILLYSYKLNEVQPKGGLNWGLGNAHVNLEDAYFAVTKAFIRENPDFFPPHGSTFIARFDDGVSFTLRMEGTQVVDDETVAKNISTDGDKSILGHYLRSRLGVSPNHLITREDLRAYGREDIDVSFNASTGEYEFDFHI